MSKEHQRRVAKLEESRTTTTLTAVGIAPARMTEEEANRAISGLAEEAGYSTPIDVLAIRQEAEIEPEFLGVCDLQDLLTSVARQGQRVTDTTGEAR